MCVAAKWRVCLRACVRVHVVAQIRRLEINGSAQMGESAGGTEREREQDKWRAGQENTGDEERGG